MVFLNTESMLDELWDEAEGTIELGSVKATYNVRPKNKTKEQWKRKWNANIRGENDYCINKKNEIIIPGLGII